MEKIKVIETQTLAIIRDFLKKIGRERVIKQVSANAIIDKDLGIDSLGRVELFMALEKDFDVKISESTLTHAQTVQDIINAVANAAPADFTPKERISHNFIDLNTSLPQAQTLNEVLELHAEATPDFTHIYFQDEHGQEIPLTYKTLHDKAKRIAFSLRDKGLTTGDTVAIMLPSSPEFFFSFLGILLAGGVPVPIYPPYRPDKIEEYAKREAAILQNAEARFLITFGKAKALSHVLKGFIPTLKAVVTVDDLVTDAKLETPIEVSTDDAALIQYTSGSTGLPKGVLLTHRNLLANVRATAEAIELKPTDIVVSWLPLYHDMGLIGTWLGSLYQGIPIVVMSPMTFLTRPERWLWAIHYHRATISAAPNFAFELCIRKIDDKDIEGLDLSSWRLVFNGAEAVRPETLTRFTKRFSAYDFRDETHFPVYGLAESSVALVFPPINRKPVIDRIKHDVFDAEQKAEPAAHDDKKAREFVAVGKAIPGHTIRIVDSHGQVLPERHVGVLQFRGPSTMQGYYLNPTITHKTFSYGWCDTGDMAYLADGEVYITGRKKDMIITAGRNLYPEEIEHLASEVDDVRKGCVIAFGVEDKTRGTESLVIVAETNQKDKSKHDPIIQNVIDAVASNIGIPPAQVALVPVGAIPKTSSGKLRRSECKKLYVAGKLTKKGLNTWQQATKVLAESMWRRTKAFFTKAFDIAYTGYCSIIFALLATPAFLLMFLLPKKLSPSISKLFCRLFLALSFCPVKITNKEYLNTDTNLLYIPNHASYIDSIVLMSILPSHVRFVGKKELMGNGLFKMVLERIGMIPVERMDVSQSLDDFKSMKDCLKSEHSLVIFPEGTFAFATGLRPFKLGAFKLAVDNQLDVCPVAIKGTRHILRGTRPLLKPGKVEVTFLPTIKEKTTGTEAIIDLLQNVRESIAEHCGEPIINVAQAGPESVAR